MLDINFIREHPDVVRRTIENKKSTVDVDELLKLDGEYRELKQKLEALERKRNENARTLPTLATGKVPLDVESADQETIKKHGQDIRQQILTRKKRFTAVETRREELLLALPNIPTPDTPVGSNEADNLVVRTVGKKPVFNFAPQEHWQLGKDLDIFDNERAAKISGSRFTYLKGDGALLEFALLQYALSVLTSRQTLARILEKASMDLSSIPFVPVVPPELIKPEVMHKMARLEPREERYHVPNDDLYLIGSAEHALGALHMDETLEESQLPVRYVGFSSAFRREAGSYGKDVHGILRMHQFDKLEIESFTLADQSLQEQDFVVALQEHLLQSLGLPYQVVLICTGDMGAPDARQIDLETWFPGQGRYRETHTSDLVTDYQARRLHTKVRRASGRSEFVHMNDATVFAIGRMLAVILENYQRPDGSVEIPTVLRPFLGGRAAITRNSR